MLIFCQIVIGLVFTFSARGKARSMTAFQEAITDFNLLPQRWSKGVAWLLLIGEFAIVALMLPLASLPAVGFLLAVLLLILFSFALVTALWRKQKIACNCFGQTTKQVSVYDVIRNLVIIVCGLTGFFLIWVSPVSLAALGWIDVIGVGLIAAIFVTVVTNLNEIVLLYKLPIVEV